MTKFLSLSQMQAEGCCDFLMGTGLSGKNPQSLDNAMVTSGQGSPADPCTRFCLSLHKVCSFPLWMLRNSSLRVQMAIKSIFFPRNFKLLRELCAQPFCETNCMEITQIITGFSGLPWHYQVAVLLWCPLQLHSSVMR